MKKLVISIIQYLIFLSLGLGLLWLVFRKIDLTLVVREIRSLNYYWIAAVLFVGFLSHIARAMRWNLMINAIGYKTNTIRTFYAVMIGYLANTAIPRIGEVTRCGILNRSEKIPINSLIGTVISERIIDVIFLLVMTIIVVLNQFELVGGFVNQYLLYPFRQKISEQPELLYLLVAVLVIFIAALILGYLFIRPRLRHLKLYQKVKTLILGFWDGIISIRKLKRKWLFILLTLAIWLNYFLMTYLCFFAMQSTSQLSWVNGLVILSLGSFGFVAPVPGGIGAYHFIVTAILFELYHIPKASAASFATIAHFVQTMLLVGLGAVCYLLFFVYMHKHNGNKN